jgi:hypothetical protein
VQLHARESTAYLPREEAGRCEFPVKCRCGFAPGRRGRNDHDHSDGQGATLKEFGYRKAHPGEDADTFGNVPVLRSLNKEFPDVQTLEGGRIDAVLVETV